MLKYLERWHIAVVVVTAAVWLAGFAVIELSPAPEFLPVLW